MYRLIGIDQREYGGVALEQLQQWVRGGRVNGQTPVLAPGAPAWRPAAEIPELVALFSPLSPLPPLSPLSPPAATFAAAADQVRGPAIFMMVLASLDLRCSITGLFFIAANFALPDLFNLPRQNVELQRQFTLFLSVPAQALSLALSVVCVIGAAQMLRLRSYGWSLAAAILMILSCGGCCCFLNLAAGIWALVVLSKHEVKAAFP